MATVGTKLTIESTSVNGKSSTLNVGYINPNVTDGTLKTFADKLFSFSTNNVKGVYRVTTENITDASEDTPTPEIDSGTYTYQLNAVDQVFNINSTNSSVTLTMSTTATNSEEVDWNTDPSGNMEIGTESQEGAQLSIPVSFNDFTPGNRYLKVYGVESGGDEKITNFVQFIFVVS